MVGFTNIIAAFAALSAHGLAYKIHFSSQPSCDETTLDAATADGSSDCTGECHAVINEDVQAIKVEGWKENCKLELYHQFDCSSGEDEPQNVLDRPDNYDEKNDYVCIGNMQTLANLDPALYDSMDIRYVCD